MSWKISRLNTIWFPLAFEQTFIGQRGNEKKLTNHICSFRSDQFETEIFDPDDTDNVDNPDAFSTFLQIVNL